jgi:predicted amidohydrolase YtcJ
MNKALALLSCCILLNACSSKKAADLIVYNGTIYTVDSAFSVAEAMAVKDGKIVAVGKSDELLKEYEGREQLDAKGGFIYPGLIDAHAHFMGYAMGLQTANLVGTKSWEEVVQKVVSFSKEQPEGWLMGRGWDQNDWSVKEFPTKEQLDSLFPDRPVLLKRVDGHAALVNQKALNAAGIKAGDKLTGGIIETKNGKLTGILIDNAVDLVTNIIPPPSPALLAQAVMKAQRNCFAVGLTTIDDCGLDYEQVLFLDSMQKAGQLKMRLYVMLSDLPKNYDYLLPKGKIKTDRLNVRAFKIYADGSLGSRGACLLQPYSDKHGHYGFLLSNPAHFDSMARILYGRGFQMCTHAIGDSGIRTFLNIYGKYLKQKNDLRWRIEHAQVVNENDFPLFGTYSIIPSVQPTHATSDMYWAGDRVGPERVKGAYAYKRLLEQNGWLPLGTDAPVEDISPLKTFYAAVFRMDAKGYPAGGYQPENALTKEQALKGMTIWAARANFEENEKGSLEPGKFADFVILDKDLLKTDAASALGVQVLKTYSNGEKVYER